ncbi:MAG: Mur ligase family protein [Candidatus Shapirobacteria bacterium]|jgi:UDP-N-acetylmuramate: L-alanyl-gamma-D-glutamyl-meso-diaminopimelate ligase
MHIHVIGIAGTMTCPLAIALKKAGHTITGSDQEKIYPPISTNLKNADIPINTLKNFKIVDLAIIGSSYLSFSNTKSEFDIIKKLNIPYISATKYVGQNIVKKNSILVVGTGGKTTITSLITWIFLKAKLNPNYMFGGQSLNKIPSLDFTTGDWSIVEGDESINGLDTKAKFLYYPAKYVILTGANWEHKESYKNESDNLESFRTLIKKIPPDGLLITNSLGHKTETLSLASRAKVIFYNGQKSDYKIIKKEISQISKLTFVTPKGNLSIKTSLLGTFNFENILAAVTLCMEIGINPKIIQKAVSSFRGISRRLQKIISKNNLHFYDDFAQSPERIKSALDAVKLHFPNQRIFVYLEPHASFLLTTSGLIGLGNALSDCTKIILSKIPFKTNIPISTRATAKHYSDEIGDNLIYIPQNKELYKYFHQTLKPNDILVHFSSGGAEGLKTFKKITSYRTQ